MADTLSFLLTNYEKAVSGGRNLLSKGVTRGTNFFTTAGNVDRMLMSDPTSDTIDGITNLITQQYMRGRYNQVITISLRNERETMENVSIVDLDTTFDAIDSTFIGQYPILFICIVPRQIYINQKNIGIGEKLAEDACDMLKRYGFIDIGCKIHNVNVPKYVLIRANDIGDTGITENFKEYW